MSCSDHGFSVSCSSFYRQVAWLERVARYECPYIVSYTFVRNIALRTIDDASHETARTRHVPPSDGSTGAVGAAI